MYRAISNTRARRSIPTHAFVPAISTACLGDICCDRTNIHRADLPSNVSYSRTSRIIITTHRSSRANCAYSVCPQDHGHGTPCARREMRSTTRSSETDQQSCSGMSRSLVRFTTRCRAMLKSPHLQRIVINLDQPTLPRAQALMRHAARRQPHRCRRNCRATRRGASMIAVPQ